MPPPDSHHPRTALFGQGVRYLIATGISATLTLGIPLLLTGILDVPPELSVAIALATTFVVNFIVVKRFVFKSTNAALPELIRFGLSSAAFRGLDYCAFLLLHDLMKTHYMLVLMLVLGVSLVAKFCVGRWYVFSRRHRPQQHSPVKSAKQF